MNNYKNWEEHINTLQELIDKEIMIKTDFIDGTNDPNDMCKYIEFAYENFKVLNVAIGWNDGHQRERAYITYEYDGQGLDLHSLICEVFRNE